jgi:hypothetical protein
VAPFRRSRDASAFRSAGRRTEGSLEVRAVETALATRRAEAPPRSAGPADWAAVEDLLAALVRTAAVFRTRISSSSWISSYEPGRRLRLESGQQSSWVQVEHLKTCWETFERLGRIERRDVLEPGRCSAFVMALFGQLAGVDHDPDDEEYLVLAPDRSPEALRASAT